MNQFTKKGNWRWRLAQAAEIRWWQRYLRKKEPESYLSWKRDYWENFLEKIQCIVPSQAHILDAGCGPAGIFTIFPENQVTAIDPLLYHYL
ncbi:MAG: class I SAM-dependent methyltransferase [Bacteroidota bacterium]